MESAFLMVGVLLLAALGAAMFIGIIEVVISIFKTVDYNDPEE